jgi:hypothetical protein
MKPRDEQSKSGLPIGAVVKSSMNMFSQHLLQGCEHYAEKAASSETVAEVLYANTAYILFSTSVAEAQLNEWISILSQIKAGTKSSAFWKTLEQMQRTLKVHEKWNLIASYQNATLWDNAREPFQSYITIKTLRNELVHYKGKFREKHEAPSNPIKGLMRRFKLSTKATIVDNDISSWVHELLTKKDLGPWVYKKTKTFHESFFQMLMEEPRRAVPPDHQ